MQNNKQASYLLIVFILSASVLTLIKIHDVDAWLHLSIGRHILERGGIPDKELFTFAAPQIPFLYTSWFFGVICYLTYAFFGVLGLNILKSACILGAFTLLLRDALRPYRNYVLAVLVLTVAVLFSQYRFVLRPDIFFMLFLACSIFVLNAYLYEGKKYLYYLPLVYLLWTNSHSSIVIMAIVLLAFLVGGVLQRWLANRNLGDIAPTPEQLKVILIISVVSLAVSLMNPFFMDQITYGYKVLSLGWYKQHISELYPPNSATRGWLIICAFIIMLSFVVNIKRFSFIHLFIIVPFIAISFTAIRFKFLPVFVGAPIVVRNMSAFFETSKWKHVFHKPLLGMTSACIILALAASTVLQVGSFGKRNIHFGVGFDYAAEPRGAIEYMDRAGITGNIFNTFQFGQYIVWTSYPRRKVYVDGRGNLPIDLLKKMDVFRRNRNVLNELADDLNFDVLLIQYNPSGKENEKKNYFNNPDWALVYWDDISLLYLKRGGVYQQIINKDEYRTINPDASFPLIYENIRGRLQDPFFVENFIRELKRNIKDTDSSRAKLILGLFYSTTGLYEQAITTLHGVKSTWVENFDYEKVKGLGYVNYQMGKTEKALSYYKQALKVNDTAEMRFMIGSVYFSDKNYTKAAHHLKKAIQEDKKFFNAYPLLISTYQFLGKDKESQHLQKMYDSLKRSP